MYMSMATFDHDWFDELRTFMEQTSGVPYPESELPGGADSFLAFIQEELKPFIANRYPVDSADTTLVGNSLGGLFALYALFTSPHSFERYVAISPAVQTNKEFLFDLEAAMGDVPVRLFMAAAEWEDGNYLASVMRMADQIQARSRPSFKYTFELFFGETHSSVAPVAFTRGLRTVFDPPPLLLPEQ
jgi:uncharacterized protein